MFVLIRMSLQFVFGCDCFHYIESRGNLSVVVCVFIRIRILVYLVVYLQVCRVVKGVETARWVTWQSFGRRMLLYSNSAVGVFLSLGLDMAPIYHMKLVSTVVVTYGVYLHVPQHVPKAHGLESCFIRLDFFNHVSQQAISRFQRFFACPWCCRDHAAERARHVNLPLADGMA